MAAKSVSEVNVDELVRLITRAVVEAVSRVIEEFLEDIIALSSPRFIESIRRAREEYRCGEYVDLEELKL